MICLLLHFIFTFIHFFSFIANSSCSWMGTWGCVHTKSDAATKMQHFSVLVTPSSPAAAAVDTGGDNHRCRPVQHFWTWLNFLKLYFLYPPVVECWMLLHQGHSHIYVIKCFFLSYWQSFTPTVRWSATVNQFIDVARAVVNFFFQLFVFIEIIVDINSTSQSRWKRLLWPDHDLRPILNIKESTKIFLLTKKALD